MWLFDTVALSEARKKNPNAGFSGWAAEIVASDVHTSVLCLGEIRRGIERLPPGEARSAFERWLDSDLPAYLDGRVLELDAACAHAWGRMGANRSLPPIDSLIAATALVHGLTVVTRNTRDFDGLGVPVLNPWN